MGVKKLDINSPEWFAFVEAHPNSTIFHHPAWAGLIAECYGYKPFALATLNELGQVDVGIPFMDVNSRLTGHRWVALPFSDFCAPLYHDRLGLDTLVECLLSLYSRKAIPRVEIRAYIPLKDTIYQDNSFVWHTIKLINDPEALLKTFDKSRVREPIRQAAKRGVEVRWGTSKADMHIFYDLLVSTRRRLGTPVQPKRYFDLLWDRLIEKKLGFLLLAYGRGEPIAGTVFLYYKEMLTAKYNASLPKYWKVKANQILYWSAIKWGCENKFDIFDFGRTEITNRNLRHFKSGWGTEEQALTYSSISRKPIIARTGRLNRIVEKVIKKSPLWVCRLSGELLYKHFA